MNHRSTAPWILVLPALFALTSCRTTPHTPTTTAARTSTTVESPSRSVDSAADAFRDHLSDVWVEGQGTVTRLLRDDTKRPRHQRFVVRVDGATGQTVMIAHNIDLAPRVPFKRGDRVSFRGQYVWNAQGGVVHWTHRDPHGGKDSGGWIRWREFVYR
ncbi:MAG: DUF3465 domain-containing protein [Candidatus Eisenbacteria bacterium]